MWWYHYSKWQSEERREKLSRVTRAVLLVLLASFVVAVGAGAAFAQTVVCDPYGQRCTEVLGESETRPPAPAVPATQVLGIVETKPVADPGLVAVAPAAEVRPQPALPVTGADIAGLVVLAAFLLGAGALLVSAGGRKERTAIS